MKKALQWFLINGGIVGLFLFGIFLPNEGFLYLSISIMWMFGFISLVFLSKSLLLDVYETNRIALNRSVPFLADVTYDIAVVLMLGYFGFVATGVMYLLHSIFYNSGVKTWEDIKAGKITKESVKAERNK